MLFVNLDKKYAGKPMTSARLNQLFHQLSNRTGIELGLVVLDYIQKLGDRAAGNRAQAID